jgi:hypothetical protein
VVTDYAEFLNHALARLDLLLHREILRLRAAYQLSLDEFRGLYVSDEHVDQLFDEGMRQMSPGADVSALTQRADQIAVEIAAAAPAFPPWSRLTEEFELSAFEQDVLLLALAPELDLKYETLYAYLNNDVNRKWPTHDLALRLFTDDAAQAASSRRELEPTSTLYASGLLRQLEPPQQSASSLATSFAASPVFVRFVLQLPTEDPQLATFVTSDTTQARGPGILSTEQLTDVESLSSLFAERPPPVLVFEGRSGSGREAAAQHLCDSLSLRLLRVDLDAARLAGEALPHLLDTLVLVARLENAALWAAPLEAVLDASGKRGADARLITTRLLASTGPLILGAGPGVAWRQILGDARCLHVPFPDPPRNERERLWALNLAERGVAVPPSLCGELADNFALNASQIRRAVASAADARPIAGKSDVPLSEELYRAARAESGHELAKLATKVEQPHSWSDLVLPAATLQRVREVAAAIRHRHRVFDEWGFGRRIATGRGLKVLFAGTSGTGKTMTAGVIAREIGVDLYRIDLATVVSKYIGETEKNLDRIFRAADDSNAILFFDEADALFGKRSEVKDAHDRYANIEISYLLQKMEQHEGAVILATNLRKNIDEAFGRRMHYVIEFPMPDARQRELLWRGIFPPTAPLADDVDLPFLGRQFGLAGGDIQNVALDAAFLAAQDGQVITMRQLVVAVARQMAKQGRIPAAAEFRQYHDLIGYHE